MTHPLHRPRLVPAPFEHGDRLHALFCMPEVYRYLADGAPPARAITDHWLEKSSLDRARTPCVGLFELLEGEDRLIGCGRTHLLEESGAAELTYVLHPDFWGQGLATMMGWTLMQQAFDSALVETMIAGTDDPNTASQAVMRRLGMRFHRHTQNARWSGVEYIRRADDPTPDPVPGTVPFGPSQAGWGKY